jgi:NADH-quinone oxidoreductase subunit L
VALWCALAYNMAVPVHNPRTAEVPDSRVLVNPVAFGQPDKRDREIVEREHSLNFLFMLASALISLLGIYLAFVYHLKARNRAEQLAQQRPLLTRILDHKYWVDEIYQAGIVEPLRTLGGLLAWIDRVIVDGLVDGFALLAQAIGAILKVTTQRGYLQGYALTMVLGIALILILMFV